MDEEFTAVTATLNSFLTFHKWQYQQVVKPKSIKYNLLTLEEKSLLDFYPDLLRDLGQCLDINRLFTQELALTAAQDWGIPQSPEMWGQPSLSDYDKVRSTLLQMAREWGSDGEIERQKTFGRILDKATSLYPSEDRANIKVLVPGCGLGRLVFEFVKRGFWTQGNEMSYHMLLALGFMLNRVPYPSSHTIFPYVHRLSHLARRLHQVRPVLIPDESAMSIFGESEQENARVGELMSMVAGSFVDLYGPPGMAESEAYTQDELSVEFRNENKGQFHVVATSFFIDTAHNVIDYLKTIHHCLHDDGIWINIGPLHWHFENDLSTHLVKKVMEPGQDPVETQIIMEGMELSREELFALMEKVGFVVEEAESGIETTYSSDTKALSNFTYHAEYWVAKKRKEASD